MNRTDRRQEFSVRYIELGRAWKDVGDQQKAKLCMSNAHKLLDAMVKEYNEDIDADYDDTQAA